MAQVQEVSVRELKGLIGDIPTQGLPVGPSTSLILSAWSSSQKIGNVRGVVYSFGKFYLFNLRFVTLTDRSAGTEVMPVSGVLLHLHVGVTTATVRGETYIRVQLRRDGQDTVDLINDYLSSGYFPSWPPGTPKDSIEGPGFIRSVLGTNPAAGVEISETVPTNARWKLLSVFARLVTDGAGTPTPGLLIDDGTNTLFFIRSTSSQAVSVTIDWSWTHGLGVAQIDVGSVRTMPLPIDIILPAGYRITTSTAGIDAGDDWAAPRLLVEEWIVP